MNQYGEQNQQYGQRPPQRPSQQRQYHPGPQQPRRAPVPQQSLQQYAAQYQPQYQPQSQLICPRCHSSNVHAQVVNEMDLKTKHKGLLWWIFVGWWWFFIKWIFLTIPAIIVKIFKPKNYKTVNRAKTYLVCQNCGNTWTK